MISDVLSDAIEDIEGYEKNGFYSDDLKPWIVSVKGVMDALRWHLDTPPFEEEAMSPSRSASLETYLTTLRSRFGTEIKIVRKCRRAAEIEIMSPTGLPLAGGLLWWEDGRWLFGGLPKQFPEWWNRENWPAQKEPK